MTQATRRTVLLTGLAGLAGCGFHPVYAPDAFGTGGSASAALAMIDVGIIPERAGQLLRQDLQQRFEGTGDDSEKRYDLQVLLAFSEEGMAINPDNSSSRLRFSAAASFVLRARDSAQTVVTSGSARQIDAANIIDNQYFAIDLETETITKRLMNALADQISLELATYFKLHPPKPVTPLRTEKPR